MNTKYMATPEVRPKCGCCDQGRLDTRYREETVEYGEEGDLQTVQADRVPVSVCDSCGNVFVTPATLKARHNYVCRALGLITPDEIQELRKRHGMTIAEFARITKIGEATISRWERYRILPNGANSSYLTLLRQNPNLVESLIKQNASIAGQAVADPVPSAERFRFSLPAELKAILAAKAPLFDLVGCR